MTPRRRLLSDACPRLALTGSGLRATDWSGGAVLAADGPLLETACPLGGDDGPLDDVTSDYPSSVPGQVSVDTPLAVPNE